MHSTRLLLGLVCCRHLQHKQRLQLHVLAAGGVLWWHLNTLPPTLSWLASRLLASRLLNTQQPHCNTTAVAAAAAAAATHPPCDQPVHHMPLHGTYPLLAQQHTPQAPAHVCRGRQVSQHRAVARRHHRLAATTMTRLPPRSPPPPGTTACSIAAARGEMPLPIATQAYTTSNPTTPPHYAAVWRAKAAPCLDCFWAPDRRQHKASHTTTI